MILYYSTTTKKAIGYSLTTKLPEEGASALPEGQAYVENTEAPEYITYIKYVVVDDTDLEDKIVSYPPNVEDIILADALEVYKGEKYTLITEWLEVKMNTGVEYTFPGSVVDVVQTRNPDDLVAIQGLVNKAQFEDNFGNMAFMTEFRALSNTIYNLNLLEVYNLSNVVNTYITLNRSASWKAKDDILAATTTVEVDLAMTTLLT